ncbi:ribonuclease P protein component [Sphingobacterium sp. lm-10]|uniref:ribonuclease P protein component n=1 Tax=Sphingobacterium sp. lm-10 TaxID=2944904 RepID=UPI00202221DA|nr:ribonuclease P protein component [Sphingobacterium sp. lm-10]MCL7989048.1 ribonuclease P protein component [Sphingobacterium sp. lm-10]
MNTFKKEERLCSVRLIQSLFHSGSSFVVYPFRVVCHFEDRDVGSAQVLISVSKRRFKLAVTRNRIKRRMREAYRLEKSATLYPFVEKRNLYLAFALQYIGRPEEATVSLLREKLITVFKKLQHESDRLDQHLSD